MQLDIYRVMLEVLRALPKVLVDIGHHDRDLESQLRRAATSVALNIAEASGVRGKNQGLRYSTALGSARETSAAIEIAVALGYTKQVDPVLLDRLDRVTATLVKLSRCG